MFSKKDIFFNELSKYSDTIDIINVLEQWTIIAKKKGEQNCICRHLIKHYAHVYNMRTGHILTIGVGCCKKYGISQSITNMLLIEFFSDTDVGSLILKNGFFDINCDIDFLQFLENKINENNNVDKENLEFHIRHLEVLKQNMEELVDNYHFYLGQSYIKKIEEFFGTLPTESFDDVVVEPIVEEFVEDVVEDVVEPMSKDAVEVTEILIKNLEYCDNSTIRRLRNITKGVREIRRDIEELNEKLREHRKKIEFFSIKI